MDARGPAIVALRPRAGEFRALEELGSAEQSVQPLLTFEPDGGRAQVVRIVEVVRRLHRLGRRTLLDTFELVDRTALGSAPIGMLQEVTDLLSYAGDLFDTEPVPFVPVIRGDAPDMAPSIAGEVIAELGAGGALRLRSGQNRSLEQVGAAHAIATGFGPFRSVGVLAGSVPSMLQQTSTWHVPRVEESLWERVGEAADGGGDGLGSASKRIAYAASHHLAYLNKEWAA